MEESLSVAYENALDLAKAERLAQQLQLPINNQASRKLLIKTERLVLQIEPFSAMHADFSSLFIQKCRAAGKKQALIQACKPTLGMKVIDATAGWGKDAAMLASFGAEVLMLERQPFMAVLLADALELREQESRKSPLNLKVQATDACIYLQALTPAEYPDLIYIDPMHPERQKSALVKKNMQVLQQLIGPDEDPLELLKLALTRVKKKVVVKWPKSLAPLLPANASIKGKTVRFDIYLPIS